MSVLLSGDSECSGSKEVGPAVVIVWFVVTSSTQSIQMAKKPVVLFKQQLYCRIIYCYKSLFYFKTPWSCNVRCWR